MHVCICQKCAKKKLVCVKIVTMAMILILMVMNPFFRISAVVSSAFLKIFLPYYQWRYQPILW